MRIPGLPSNAAAVLSTASDLTALMLRPARKPVAAVQELAGRSVQLLDQVSSLLTRVESLLGHVEATAGRADRVIDRCDEARAHADDVIQTAGRMAAQATPLLNELEPRVYANLPLLDAVAQVDPRLIGRLEELAQLTDLIGTVLRMKPLLDAVAELDPSFVGELEKIAPLLRSLDRLDRDATAKFATSYADVLDQLPTLLGQMTDDAIPAMQELAGAVPDVRVLREIVTRLEPVLVDVEHIIVGMPGAARARRRGEKELDDAGDDRGPLLPAQNA